MLIQDVQEKDKMLMDKNAELELAQCKIKALMKSITDVIN